MRAWASLSARRTSGSPADTFSPALTSTSPMRPARGAAIFISPDTGSMRPGATACQFFPSGASARAVARTDSSACSAGAGATSAQAIPTTARPSGVVLPFAPTVNCKLDLAFSITSRASLLFADDESVFDANDPIGERHYTRIVRDDQHRAGRIF